MSLVLDYTGGVFAAKPTGGSVGTDPAGDPNFADVSLLLHMDGTNGSTTFTDSSSSNVTVTPYGTAQITTADSKFGGASVFFDNGTSNPELAVSGYPITNSDFTIELWTKGNLTSGGHLFDLQGTNRLTLFYEHSGSSAPDNSFGVFDTNYRGNANSTSAQDLANNWNHVAVVRNSGTIKIYVNGTSITSWSNNSSYTNATLNIGNTHPSRSFNATYAGYIDEFRVSNIARYTSNFTPPTAAFLDTGPTLDLSSGNTFVHAPSANVAYAFSNPPASGTAIDFTLKVTPSATVTITWPSSVKWAGGTAPSAPASGETDAFTFYSTDGGTSYYGFHAGDAYS